MEFLVYNKSEFLFSIILNAFPPKNTVMTSNGIRWVVNFTEIRIDEGEYKIFVEKLYE